MIALTSSIDFYVIAEMSSAESLAFSRNKSRISSIILTPIKLFNSDFLYFKVFTVSLQRKNKIFLNFENILFHYSAFFPRIVKSEAGIVNVIPLPGCLRQSRFFIASTIAAVFSVSQTIQSISFSGTI